MAESLAGLKTQARELGMNLSAWDRDGQNVLLFEPPCEFCKAFSVIGGRCVDAMEALARSVVVQNEPVIGASPLGCCLLGVPVRQRRRLYGAVTACFPVLEMLEEETFARLCDRVHLDRRAAGGMARQSCRHSVHSAGDFLRVLDLMLRHRQEIHNAQDELASLSDNLTGTYEGISLLYRISSSMWVNQSPADFVRNICQELLHVMKMDTAAAVVYAHPPAVDRDIVVSAGAPVDEGLIRNLANMRIAPTLDRNGRAALDNKFGQRVDDELAGVVKNWIAMPLMTEEGLTGMLIGINKGLEGFDSPDLKLISSIGNQASVFLSNNWLYADLHGLLMGVLHALTESIDAKDPYTCGHSRRVALISRRLAEVCQFPPAKVEQIYLAGLLHDIGKIGVPEHVLRKEGRLTDEEYEAVKRHPDLSARILGGIRQLEHVIPAILSHHERPDGQGYPQRLPRARIPVEGLIVGLADSFDAMTSDRTYRAALPLEVAIQEIRSHAGTQFDPDLAEKLLSLDLGAFLKELRSPPGSATPVLFEQEKMR